jgi:hypothetical protein
MRGRWFACVTILLAFAACGGRHAQPANATLPAAADAGPMADVHAQHKAPPAPEIHCPEPDTSGLEPHAATAIIAVRVCDAKGWVPKVAVVAASSALPDGQRVYTDENGEAVLDKLPPGKYEISFYLGDHILRMTDIDAAASSMAAISVPFPSAREP